MIAILLAAARVASDRLEMAVRLWADPDLGPGGRDDDAADARDLSRIVDAPAGGIEVREAPALPAARDPRRRIAHVSQACFARRFLGVLSSGCDPGHANNQIPQCAYGCGLGVPRRGRRLE